MWRNLNVRYVLSTSMDGAMACSGSRAFGDGGFIPVGADGLVNIYDTGANITDPRKDLLAACKYVRGIDHGVAMRTDKEILDKYGIRDDTTRVHPNIAFGIVMSMGHCLWPKIVERMFRAGPSSGTSSGCRWICKNGNMVLADDPPATHPESASGRGETPAFTWRDGIYDDDSLYTPICRAGTPRHAPTSEKKLIGTSGETKQSSAELKADATLGDWWDDPKLLSIYKSQAAGARPSETEHNSDDEYYHDQLGLPRAGESMGQSDEDSDGPSAHNYGRQADEA